jgi:hypothetical protein
VVKVCQLLLLLLLLLLAAAATVCAILREQATPFAAVVTMITL